MDLAAVPHRLGALADHHLVGGLGSPAAVAAELPAERGPSVTEPERGGFAVRGESTDGERRGERGRRPSGQRPAPRRRVRVGSTSLSSLRVLRPRSLQNDHNRTQVTTAVPSARGRRGPADVVRARAPAAAVAGDARPVRAAGERGDAPADAGPAGRAVLRALARALSVRGRSGRRAHAGRSVAVERARLQPPGPGAPAGGRDRRGVRLAFRSDARCRASARTRRPRSGRSRGTGRKRRWTPTCGACSSGATAWCARRARWPSVPRRWFPPAVRRRSTRR